VVNRTELFVGPYWTTANIYVKQRSRDINFLKTPYVILKYYEYLTKKIRGPALFWYITQRTVEIPSGRFGTTYRPRFQGSRIDS
jgi:hypothetical protein